MAKIWGIPHNRRAKKFKNHLVIKNTSLGGYVAASWPRKGWYDNSPAGRERASIFGQVQSWTRRPQPLAQIDAIEGSEGTMYLPRDLLTKCAYGKLWEIHFKDGSVLYPVKLMSEEAQALLNSISITPGAMLVRTASQWVGIEPGPLGQLLTSQGPDGIPRWQAPASSGGGFGWIGRNSSSQESTSATKSKGYVWKAWVPWTVSAVAFNTRTTETYTVRPYVCEMHDGKITKILTHGPDTTFKGDGNVTVYLPLTKRVACDANTEYWIALSQIAPDPSDGFQVSYVDSKNGIPPFYSILGKSYFQSKLPEVGDEPGTTTTAPYFQALGA